jgi:DNA-binding transcriptional MerR regulator
MQALKELFMEMTSQVTRLMDVTELASLWRVSPHTIRAWVRKKRLKPTRICRRLLFTPAECERFLAATLTQC